MALTDYFPVLSGDAWSVTSPATDTYNCLAWSLHNTERWWWPDAMGDAYWPDAEPRRETVDGIVSLFQALGFEACESDVVETGFTKVAIFANELGPTHVARQLPSGVWTSKLGRLEDIEHATLKQLEGDMYGQVQRVLRRAAP